MNLYETLAPLYDRLFPVDPKAPAFLDALAGGGKKAPDPRGPGPRVLDAGCGTGGHALALAALGWTAVGLDSEDAMIEAARRAPLGIPGTGAGEGRSGSATFIVADLRGMGDRFERGSFDLILCLGNTLPHLADAASRATSGVASFFSEARSLLKAEGRLVLQTLNFSLPDIGPGFAFPDIRIEGATMKRSYREPPADHPGVLRFVVELIQDGRSQVGETLLLPLGPRRIESLLGEAGFGKASRYSGWGGQAFDEEKDRYCITVAGS